MLTSSARDRAIGAFLGLAVGDALGMPVEFENRGQFEPVTGLRSGGPFNLPAGYWTDDTSMALCLADSILSIGGYDSFDVMSRYSAWRRKGERSSTGRCFDVGNQTSMAIAKYERAALVHGRRREAIRTELGDARLVPADAPRSRRAGNGSIMRLAPVVIASFASGNSPAESAHFAAISARETHYSVVSEEAARSLGTMLHRAMEGRAKGEVLEAGVLAAQTVPGLGSRLWSAAVANEDGVPPTGHVVDTMRAAIWAFMTTETFAAGALKVVNLGGDSDTIGAVYGQLAGAFYGARAIPADWRGGITQSDELQRIAEALVDVSKFDYVRTRFVEDSLNIASRDSTLQLD